MKNISLDISMHSAEIGNVTYTEYVPQPKWMALLECMKNDEVRCWLDSGSLLGMVRNGSLNTWEKDIDLGVWYDDFVEAQRICRDFAEQENFLYRELRVHGIPYVILLDAIDPEKCGSLPIAVHVFYRVGADAWSPQPHSIVWATAKYPRYRLRQFVKARGRASGLLSFGSENPRHMMAILLAKIRLTRAIGTWLKKHSRKNWQKGSHMCDGKFGRLLFDLFQWVVPAHFFENLRPLEGYPNYVLAPTSLNEYLTIRYGDWKTPVKNWFYLVDDGCIFPLSFKRLEEISTNSISTQIRQF